MDTKLEDAITQELADEVLAACPCHAVKTADGKMGTGYTCQTPEQRDVLARLLEPASIITVARQVIPESEPGPK